MAAPPPLRIGVLALQGSFAEHTSCLAKCSVETIQVRKPEQLDGLDGLIIPGGESTAMALIAEQWGLMAPLRQFIAAGRPVWGTCAGLIFLADRATGVKRGGQALLGGLDVDVCRNFFGAQVASFETPLPAPAAFSALGPSAGSPFRAIFIRAPAILSTGPGVETLCACPVPPGRCAGDGHDGLESVIVAVRGGPGGRLLATAFHPELTADPRWHEFFVGMCRAAAGGARWPSRRCRCMTERTS